MGHLDDNFNETLPGDNSQPGSDGTEAEKLARYKQQMQGWQTEAQNKSEAAKAAEERAERYRQSLINTNYNAVYNNGELNVNALSRLQQEDPDLANDVASKFEINGKSVSSADEIISYMGGDTTGATGTLEKEKLVDEITNKLKASFEHDQVIKNVRNQFAMLPDGKREEAQKYFDELVIGRKVTSEKAAEYARMATAYVYSLDNSTTKKDKALAAMASMNFGGGTVGNQQQTDDGMYSDDEIKDFVKGHTGTQAGKQLYNILYGNNQ